MASKIAVLKLNQTMSKIIELSPERLGLILKLTLNCGISEGVTLVKLSPKKFSKECQNPTNRVLHRDDSMLVVIQEAAEGTTAFIRMSDWEHSQVKQRKITKHNGGEK